MTDDVMGLGKFVRQKEAINSGDDMTLGVKEAAEGSDIVRDGSVQP